MDRGNFLIYLRDQPVGAETFAVEGRADSINRPAPIGRSGRTAMIEKQMILTATRPEFALRFTSPTRRSREDLHHGVVAARTTRRSRSFTRRSTARGSPADWWRRLASGVWIPGSTRCST
jgi:hypothetical protein